MDDKRFNLMYVSSASFWKNACIKPYQHHDVLLKYLNRIMPLEIHIALPMSGDSYFKDLLETGNKSRVMSTWRDLPFHIYPTLYDGPIDGMLINGNGATWNYTLPDGTEVSDIEACDYLVNRAIECRENGLPVILFDPDNFVSFIDGNADNKSFDKRVNFCYRIYEELKDYDKFTLASPFEYGSMIQHPGEIFMPFTLDKEIQTEIKPLSERSCFTKYVGNNYYREHFVEYFKSCARFGVTEVYGSGWTHFHESCPEVAWKHKFPLTTDRVYDFYSDSQIGLYGSPPPLTKLGHYTLRVREFYEAGTLIVPEDVEHLKSAICIDFFNVNIQNDILGSDTNPLEGLTDSLYEEIVQEQRAKLIKKFDAEQYAQQIAERLSK